MKINGSPLHEAIAGYFWLEQMVREAGLNQAQINRYGIKSGQDSKRMTRWKNRGEVPTNQSVGRLAEAAPKAAEFFRTVPYRLLDPSPLTVAEIRDLMSPYHDGDGESLYHFPNDGLGLDLSECGPPCRRKQSPLLLMRGDIYAFFAILALVREAETLDDTADHIRQIQCLYYCLASLGRFSWTHKEFGLLCLAVRNNHLSVRKSAVSIGVDWEALSGQFYDPEYEPDPRKRRLDAETGFPVPVANPTFRIRPSERGVMPIWPYHEKSGAAQDTAREPQLEMESTVEEAKKDGAHFFVFMMIMSDWKAERHDWETFLGCKPGQSTFWIDGGMDSMTKITRDRVIAIFAIHETLVSQSDEQPDLADAFRVPRAELGGDSIHQRLRCGRVLETLRDLSTN